MRRIVTFGLCVLALPMLAAAQTKDDFAYWDANNSGDLTCSEAEDGPDGGLRLPAYQDDRDGTGIIYEWLERSRSSDTDNDGVACDSASNPSGYIPNVQPVDDPSQGCPVDAETWRGLQVCEEQPREGYDRDAFGSAYSSLEDDIIDMLPPTMRAGGQVYTPYSCRAFHIRADGTAATDIEHIVALAEAHDSGIADDRRRDIAADLDNLTIADPQVNRTEKSDRDAGEWTPARHGAWFAERVIAVKLEYELSVDPRERDALEALLADGGAQLSCVDADTTSPTVAISSDAGAPVTGPFSITVAFSEPVTGFELEDLVVGNGSASELQGNNASYMATITPAASGTVTVDIAAGAAQDGAGNPSAAAVQFSIVADLTPVPALPVIGALALAPAVAGRRSSPTDGELTRRPAATQPRLRPVRRHGGGRPRQGRPRAVLAPVPRSPRRGELVTRRRTRTPHGAVLESAPGRTEAGSARPHGGLPRAAPRPGPTTELGDGRGLSRKPPPLSDPPTSPRPTICPVQPGVLGFPRLTGGLAISFHSPNHPDTDGRGHAFDRIS